MNIGEIIKQLRIESGLTQEKLSKLLGVSRNVICMYEKGKRSPGKKTLTKVADIFGVSLDYLICGEDNLGNFPTLNEDRISGFKNLPAIPMYEDAKSVEEDCPTRYATEKDLLATNRTSNLIFVKLSDSNGWALVDSDKKNGKHPAVKNGDTVKVVGKKDVAKNDEVLGDVISITTLL